MSNSKGPSSMRNMMYIGRNSLLPPKSPFPNTAPSYVDYVPSSVIGQKGSIKAREGYSSHQRTSSESLVIEEQPSWLDELLDEPETPVRRGGHRRSSSDSFAYIDAANVVGADYATQDDIRFHNMMPFTSWGSQEVDCYRDAQRPFVPDFNAFGKFKNRTWNMHSNSFTHQRGVPLGNILQNSGMSRAKQETELFPTTASDKKDGETGPQNLKGPSEKKDSTNGSPSASETDTKRAKQQFAQRSRVRKLQYIAELERNVQALQAEGSEVSAELEFLSQQHLILSMENKALKQRLETLAQEQLIKHVEHEVLERELERLRSLYHQQQQPQPLQHQSQQHQTSGHRRNSSKDLDLQLANLSLKQKDTSPARVDVPRQLNI